MEKAMIIQGREITPKDIKFIREMIKSHPSWGRSRLSKELALLWEKSLRYRIIDSLNHPGKRETLLCDLSYG